MEKKGFVGMFVVWFIVLLIIITVVPKIGEVILEQKITKNIVLSQTVDVNKDQIFEIMADPKQYPNVLPSTFLEIKIINQTNNVIFAEETISERGIETKMLVKHEIFPFEKHVIEILDGYAKDTKIIISYDEMDSKTNISSDIFLNTSGPLMIIVPFMSQSNFESAYSSVIQAFEDYTKLQ